MKRNELKSCAVINDLTGFGRCALNVTLPVMSALGVRVLAVPTAVLSNHTAFDEYYFSDLTDGMPLFFENWEKLGLSHDGIYTGFLGSEKQVDIILDFIKKSKTEKTHLFVDPIMGDDGKLYSTYTEELVLKMRSLVHDADIITPNLTEACLLAGVSYDKMQNATDDEIFALAKRLCSLGARCTVITGIFRGRRVLNFVYDAVRGEKFISSSKYIAGQFCGTGDLFATLLFGHVMRGCSLRRAIRRTSRFICRAVRLSERLGVSPTDGVAFEPILKYV
ncbi:MAG: pyridoxamine kinase [Oscillospiraceae bacterium]|nr:pyridoxamine kinase [Oscillospiraceae bacterium]MBQ6902234.1 pyridoxamine kinase [Oscillospiraceae bacterium]